MNDGNENNEIDVNTEATNQLIELVNSLKSEVAELRKEKSEDLTEDLIKELRDEVADLKSNPGSSEGGGKEISELRKTVLELTKKIGKLPSLRKVRKQYERGVERKGPVRTLRVTTKEIVNGKPVTKVIKFEVTA